MSVCPWCDDPPTTSTVLMVTKVVQGVRPDRARAHVALAVGKGRKLDWLLVEVKCCPSCKARNEGDPNWRARNG